MIGAEVGSVFSRHRLPSGRHGLSAEFVAKSQRWRLLGACAEAVAERGYARTTSAEVVRRAGVSPSAFYEQFEDLTACVEAACSLAAECLHDAIATACARASGAPREERAEAALEAAIRFVGAEPALAALVGQAMPWAVAAAVEGRVRTIDRLADLIGTNSLLLGGAISLLTDRAASSEGSAALNAALELRELLTLD